MSTVYMLVGIPGSGKTTFAKELMKRYNAEIISTDKVRKDNPNLKENEIWPEVYKLCADKINENKDIIFDATNITPNVRARFDNELAKYNVTYDKVAFFIKASVEECIKRVEKRNQLPGELYLPLEVIASYGKKIIPPTIDEGFKEIYIIDSSKI